MMSNLPDPIYYQGYEDTESIDNDIGSLYQKFIVPIDRIRSIAQAPNDTSSDKKKGIVELNTDPIGFMESRCHAFYRYLGLPVVGKQGFYNAGFNSNVSFLETVGRASIDQSIDPTKTLYRDTQYQLYNQMFASQSFDATLWASVLRIIRPFANVNGTLNALGDAVIPISDRNFIVDTLKLRFPDMVSDIIAALDSFQSRFGFGIDSTRHQLKPFTVNPNIEFTVMPSDNKVCVPFLKDLAATKISASPDVYLIRPGIEFILRARLRDSVVDKTFLLNVKNTLQQANSLTFTDDINAGTLLDAIEALSDGNSLAGVDIDKLFGSFSSTEAEVSLQLIKTLKSVMRTLQNAIVDLDDVESNFSFLPIPHPEGFEKGGIVRSVSPRTEMEKQLIGLTIAKLNAERNIQFEKSLGEFATSGYTDVQSTDLFSQAINTLTDRKNTAMTKGLNSIKTIEIITGEASGLGLVDILAIYTALWTIKIEELLGLLDDDSFNRLYDFNPDLRSHAVMTRKNGNAVNISDALLALEKKVSSILSFAELTYQRTFISPYNYEGGDPT